MKTPQATSRPLPRTAFLKKGWQAVMVLGILFVAGVATPRPAQAVITCTFCSYCCLCCDPATTQTNLQNAFQQHRDNFILGSFYTGTTRPAYQDLATQFVATIALRGLMWGGFYDAQNHQHALLETQKMAAETIRDYTPSEAVCQFGTLSKSLAASEARSRTAQIVISDIALARNSGNFNNIGAAGRGRDNETRRANFVNSYCDRSGMDNAMTAFCVAGLNGESYNRDIDYARVFEVPRTIDGDFNGPAASAEERDIVLLGHNLYVNQQFTKRMVPQILNEQGGDEGYALMRNVGAKQTLALNSYAAVTGMKVTGSGASRQYMRQVLTNLGMSAGDVNRFMASQAASARNPSYYAQMDILTKRLYQNPAFYAELMDKPTNVARQSAALEGLELTQDRDIFMTMSRSEMLLAALVEMEAIKLQSKIENSMTTR